MIRAAFPLAILAAAQAAGCSSPAPVEPALEARARAAVIAEEPVRGSVQFRRIWWPEGGQGGEILCGRIDAPAELEADSLRFVYSSRDDFAHIEKHELWVGPTAGMALLEQNRAIFNDLWDDSCAPAEGGSIFG